MSSVVPAPRSLTFGPLLAGTSTRGLYRVSLDDAATEAYLAEIPASDHPWGGTGVSHHALAGHAFSLQPYFAFCSLEEACERTPNADALRGLLAHLLQFCAEREDIRLERSSIWVEATGTLRIAPEDGTPGDTARDIASILLACIGGVPGPDPVASLAPLWALTTDEALYRAAARGLRGQAGALKALRDALSEPQLSRYQSAWRTHCGTWFVAHPEGRTGSHGPWSGKRLQAPSEAQVPRSEVSPTLPAAPTPRPGRSLILAGSGLFSATLVCTLGVLGLFLITPFRDTPDPGPAAQPTALNPFEEEPPPSNPFAEEEAAEPEPAPAKTPVRPAAEPRPRTRSPAPSEPEEPEEEEEPPEPPRPEPPVDHGRVVVQGNARSVSLRGAAGNFGPGSVPAGTYQIFASFDGGSAVEAGNLRVTPGQTVTLVCRSGLGRCTAR